MLVLRLLMNVKEHGYQPTPSPLVKDILVPSHQLQSALKESRLNVLILIWPTPKRKGPIHATVRNQMVWMLKISIKLVPIGERAELEEEHLRHLHMNHTTAMEHPLPMGHQMGMDHHLHMDHTMDHTDHQVHMVDHTMDHTVNHMTDHTDHHLHTMDHHHMVDHMTDHTVDHMTDHTMDHMMDHTVDHTMDHTVDHTDHLAHTTDHTDQIQLMAALADGSTPTPSPLVKEVLALSDQLLSVLKKLDLNVLISIWRILKLMILHHVTVNILTVHQRWFPNLQPAGELAESLLEVFLDLKHQHQHQNQLHLCMRVAALANGLRPIILPLVKEVLAMSHLLNSVLRELAQNVQSSTWPTLKLMILLIATARNQVVSKLLTMVNRPIGEHAELDL